MQIKQLELIVATESMLEKINSIYKRCRKQLEAEGILQWDDRYPNKEYFQQCIEKNELYVLIRDEEILGQVVLNEFQDEEWNVVPWVGSKPLIIHSLMIDPDAQGGGLGGEFVKRCEQIASDKGYDSIRLDAYLGNEKAIRLYKKLGYQLRGNIFFKTKPEGHQEYLCFEKKLS